MASGAYSFSTLLLTASIGWNYYGAAEEKETELYVEEYKRDRCQEVNEKTEGAISRREEVRSVLTLSKSIAVKSQVPIQVLLEEERTEPERSPWEETPPPSPPPSLHRHTLSLSRHLLLLALHGRPNERSNRTSPPTEFWVGST